MLNALTRYYEHDNVSIHRGIHAPAEVTILSNIQLIRKYLEEVTHEKRAMGHQST